jgi:hypothetical protein
MVLQSKDLQPFMGLQNKGCRHSDVQQKRLPKQAFSGEMKKSEKYHPKGITSWSSSGRTSGTIKLKFTF